MDPSETISKYDFTTLGLAEVKPSGQVRCMFSWVDMTHEEDFLEGQNEEQEEVAEDLAKMEGHTTAMEAPLYQSYRYFLYEIYSLM